SETDTDSEPSAGSQSALPLTITCLPSALTEPSLSKVLVFTLPSMNASAGETMIPIATVAATRTLRSPTVIALPRFKPPANDSPTGISSHPTAEGDQRRPSQPPERNQKRGRVSRGPFFVSALAVRRVTLREPALRPLLRALRLEFGSRR